MTHTFALALAAALLDVTVGYPPALARRIGTPADWLRLWFRILHAAAPSWSGPAALALYLAPVAVVTALIVQGAPSGPIGFAVSALFVSILCSRQSLNRRAGEVARVWEEQGAYEALGAAEALGGDETETRLSRAAAAAIAARFADEVAALTVFTVIGGLIGAGLCRALTIAGRYGRERGDDTPLSRTVAAVEAWTIAPAARFGAVWLGGAAALSGEMRPIRAVSAPAPRSSAPAEAVMLSALGDPPRDEPSYVRGAISLMRRAGTLEIVVLIALTLAALAV